MIKKNYLGEVESNKISNQVLYRCKENDNHFIVQFEDGEPYEICIGDLLQKVWTGIGFEDLKMGLDKIGYSIVKSMDHDVKIKSFKQIKQKE